jgi:Rrf2 family protein
MLYSNACAYGIRALSRLAAIRPDGYVLLDELCAGGDLPRHFVAKILQDLVRQGLLLSAKGRGGGFALARPAEQITIYDIVACIDGTEALTRCIVGMEKCDDQQPCPQHDQWKALRGRIYDFLTQTTLAQMSTTLQRKLELLGQPIQTANDQAEP